MLAKAYGLSVFRLLTVFLVYSFFCSLVLIVVLDTRAT